MKTKFQGKFYSGRHSAPYLCEAELKEHSIILYVSDELGNAVETLHWNIDNIHKDCSKTIKKTRLKHNTFPNQIFEIEGKEFPKSLAWLYPDSPFASSPLFSNSASKRRFFLFAFLLLIALYLFFYKVITPTLTQNNTYQTPMYMQHVMKK